MKNQFNFKALILGISLWSFSSFADPSLTKICSDDSIGVTIFRDDMLADKVFYYVPKIKYKQKASGALVYEHRENADGSHGFRFQAEAYFDDKPGKIACIKEVLRKEKKLNSVSQVGDIELYPIPATQITFTSQEFDLGITTPVVTNRQYIDKPINLRLNFSNQAKFDDFMQSLSGDLGGVSVDITVSYKGVKVANYIKVDVSCYDVAKQLNANAGVSADLGKLKFTGAQIENASRSATHQSLASVVVRGDIDMIVKDVISKVMDVCFNPIKAGSSYDDFGSKPKAPGTTAFNEGSMNSLSLTDANRNDLLKAWALIMDEKMNDLQIDGYTQRHVQNLLTKDRSLLTDGLFKERNAEDPVTGSALVDPIANANFSFKKDVWKRDDIGFFNQVGLKDYDAMVVIPSLLSMTPGRGEGNEPKSLGVKKIKIVSDAATIKKPFNSGLMINSNELWTLKPIFTMYAMSRLVTASHRYPDKKPMEYKWEDKYGSPYEGLFYRVGKGSDWIPVGERIEISSKDSGSGEVQFYIDKDKLFKQIDPLLTKKTATVFGYDIGLPTVPMYESEYFYPVFTVEASGRSL